MTIFYLSSVYPDTMTLFMLLDLNPLVWVEFNDNLSSIKWTVAAMPVSVGVYGI